MTTTSLRASRAPVFILAFVMLLSACARHATATECASLLDRYVELLVREQDPKASDAEIAKQKGLTREKASHDVSFGSCPQEVSSRELGCAMRAPNVDEFEKCLE